MYGNTPQEKEQNLRQHFLDLRKDVQAYALDLRTAQYMQTAPEKFLIRSEEGAFLFDSEEVCKLFFKQIQGFGLPLFRNNDPAMNCEIVNAHLPNLKSEFFMVWGMAAADGVVNVLGLCPGKETPIVAAAMLDSFSDQPDMEFFSYDEDGETFYLRYLTGRTFEAAGVEWRFGLSVSFSDMGLSSLAVDHFVYSSKLERILGVNYGPSTFLKSKYRGFDADALGSFWAHETERFESKDLHIIQQALERSSADSYTDEQLNRRLHEMGVWKGVSAKFSQALLDEVFTEGTEKYRSSWSIADRISQISAGAETPKDQEKLERVAGRVCGLVVEDTDGKKIFKEFLKGSSDCS